MGYDAAARLSSCGRNKTRTRGRGSMSLTLEEANRIVGGALAKARELNIKISAAVVDSGGRLVALQRMDNAIWASAYGCQGKAVASAARWVAAQVRKSLAVISSPVISRKYPLTSAEPTVCRLPASSRY